MKLIRRWQEPDAVVTEALELIEESKGQISVEDLASALLNRSSKIGTDATTWFVLV